MVQEINGTLNERGAQYGNFQEQFRIAQNIKAAMRDSPQWKSLPPEMKEVLELEATKMSRILNGNPFHRDSWHDMVGYASLIDGLLAQSESKNID